MSCCTDNLPPDKKITGADILANLPVAVISPTDPSKPQASAIRAALPPTGGTVYGRPVVHDDGSIEFVPVPDAAPPAAMEGYAPDPANPWLFHPLWAPCLKRLAGLRKAPDGTLTLKSICSSASVPVHYMKPVTPLDCSSCPLREGPRKNPA